MRRPHARGGEPALETAGSIGLAGAKMLGTAVLAVGAAAIALVGAGIKLALTASDAKGDMILLFDTLGDGAFKGEEAVAMFDKLGEATGQTREKLAGTAQAFAAMGVTGVDQLEKLTLAAVSASAMAKGGGEAFEAMFKKISTAQQTGVALKIPLKGLGSLASMGLKVDDVSKRMGLSASELAKQLEKGTVDAKKFGDALSTALVEKGAGPVADAALDMVNMWERAKESVGKFFEDIDVTPFLTEVKKLFGMLDQSTATGQALKAGIGGFFKEVFAALTVLVPIARKLFLDMAIYGLQAYIAIKPIVASMQEFAASDAGVLVIAGMGAALRVMAISAAIVVGIFGALILTIGLAVAQIGILYVAITSFVAIATETLGGWAASATVMASNFIQGLVNGIVGGGVKVVGAVKDLAKSALGAFSGPSGIDAHSPSVKMAKLGEHMGSGVALGLDDSSTEVANASQSMAVSAVSAASNGASSSGASGSVGGMNVTIEAGAIVINGGSSDSVLELTEQALTQLLERIAQQQGLAA